MRRKAFERILPGAGPTPGTDRPWVALMSDWPPDNDSDLIQLIEGRFQDQPQELPLVLVVDDITGSLKADYRLRLEKLAGAGAFIVELGYDEIKTSGDLDHLIATHILTASKAAAVAVKSPLTAQDYQEWLAKNAQSTAQPVTPHPSTPTKPDGYLEFGTADTKLTPEQLEEMMKVRD